VQWGIQQVVGNEKGSLGGLERKEREGYAGFKEEKKVISIFVKGGEGKGDERK